MAVTPPNYAALLANDPTLRAVLAQINAQGVQARAGLQSGAQQLFGQLGEAPDIGSLPAALQAALKGVVTPELQGIIGQSNQAGLSTLAQLARQYQQTQANDSASLAARGLIHSGAYGEASNENLHNYTTGQYQARQNVLGQLGQLENTYLGQQSQIAGQAASATGDAQQRISDEINQGLIGPLSVGSAPKPSAPRAPSNPYGSPARFDTPMPRASSTPRLAAPSTPFGSPARFG